MYLGYIKYITEYTFITAKEVQRCLSYFKGNYMKKIAFKVVRISFPQLQYIINKLLYIYSGKSNKPLVNNGRLAFCILKCQ